MNECLNDLSVRVNERLSERVNEYPHCCLLAGVENLPISSDSSEEAVDPLGAAISRPFYDLWDRTLDKTAESLSKKLQQSLGSVTHNLRYFRSGYDLTMCCAAH